jgi:pre-60S factor REI1
MAVDASAPDTDADAADAADAEDAAIEAYLATVTRLAATDCAMCPRTFDTFEATLRHLESAHSFFFPDVRYVRDLRALYLYVCDKITVGRTCLTCGRAFASVRAVRDHMADKAHGRLPLTAGGGNRDDDDDDDGALDDGALDDDGADDGASDDGGTDAGSSARGCGEYEEFYDYSAMATVSGAPGHPDEMPLTEFTRRRPVGLAPGGFGIVLDDGCTLGHRDLRRYYRQHITERGTGGVSEEAREQIVTELRQRYRLLGLADTAGRQRETPKGSQRIIAKKRLDVGVKANKLQHFFRLQNPY